MKKGWLLAGSCMLVLAVMAAPSQGLAAIRASGVKTADMVADAQANAGLTIASYGEQTGTGGGIPLEGETVDNLYQDEMPYDENRIPDVQADDPQGDIPPQDEMNQEEPYQVIPPDGDYQEDQPAE